MKYLVGINELFGFNKINLESEETKKHFENRINKKLIEDLCDLSMDIIDIGWYLSIKIRFKKTSQDLCHVRFDHGVRAPRGYNLHYRGLKEISKSILDTSKPLDIYYAFTFDKTKEQRQRHIAPNGILQEMEEVERRIKEMYPQEEISLYIDA